MAETKKSQTYDMIKKSQRHDRLTRTNGMPIHTVIANDLMRREYWVNLTGAVYPKNGHWWGRKKNGKPKFIGPVHHAEKRYIKKADRIEQNGRI